MGNKVWSIVFGVTMLACAIGFAVSPLVGWWMPEGVSTHAHEIDFLFNLILYVTAFFFFLTEGILVWFMWQYAEVSGGKRPVADKAELPGWMKPISNVLHDQHRVEMAWTLVPAVLLLAIAFVQVESWARIKYESRNRGKQGTTPTLQVAVSARQFEWRMRYPSVARYQKWMADKNPADSDYASFGKIPQADDVYVVNELHAYVRADIDEWKKDPGSWKKKELPPAVAVHLTTRDVIHSFNLPNFRVKQDALPGKMIPVWFTPIKANCKWEEETKRFVDGYDPDGKKDDTYKWDIACAELCGWGHYRMIGRVFIHKDEAEFLDWLTKAEAESRKRDR